MNSEDAQWLCRELGYVLSDAAKELNENRASLRDQFAMTALQGLLAAPHLDSYQWAPNAHSNPVIVADAAYHFADAMLKAREPKPETSDGR